MSTGERNGEYLTEGWYRFLYQVANSTNCFPGSNQYTDIIFFWWKAVENLSDRSALRAFLHPSSLISDECPLHPGKKGLELFMATILNGENRLCFSLKQVSYIRYWLYAYRLTSVPLSLPSTHYLLTLEDLRGPPSPVAYKTEPELMNSHKDVKKHNKRVKAFAGDFDLRSLRTEFERVRSVWEERRGVWMAIDFEAWVLDHKVITEFGWSVVKWESGEAVEEEKAGEIKPKEIREEGHWKVKEYDLYRNGQYGTTDNRDRYDFGKTEELTKAEFRKRIEETILKYSAEGPLYLVFHDRHGDIEYLRQLEVASIGNLTAIPNKPPGPGIYCVDTRDMFSALEGDSKQRRGLERVCLLLKIQGFAHPHNAGNDAHYTMEVLRAMASGRPLDAQREERWPNQTEVRFGQQKGVKVEWTEADFEGDYH